MQTAEIDGTLVISITFGRVGLPPTMQIVAGKLN